MPGGSGDRRLLGYLLAPRALDLFAKSGFLAMGAVYAGTLPSVTPHPDWLLRVVLSVVILEGLVYQARYILNDLRGLVGDRLHPARRGRRAPLDPAAPGPGRLVIEVTLVLRLVAALAALLLLSRSDTDGWRVLAVGCGVVLVVGEVYDQVRHRSGPHWQRGPTVDLLLILVGAGYFVRVLVGASAVAPNEPLRDLALGFTAATFGAMVVSMVWTLEGIQLLTDGAGSRGAARYFPHQVVLARRALSSRSPDRPAQPLMGRPVTSWNAAALLAGAGAAALAWVGNGPAAMVPPVVVLITFTSLRMRRVATRGRAANLHG